MPVVIQITVLFLSRHWTIPKKPAYCGMRTGQNLYCMGEDNSVAGQSMRAGFCRLLNVCGGRDSDLVLQQTFRVRDETCPYATSLRFTHHVLPETLSIRVPNHEKYQ